jgi:hypothetical protein
MCQSNRKVNSSLPLRIGAQDVAGVQQLVDIVNTRSKSEIIEGMEA